MGRRSGSERPDRPVEAAAADAGEQLRDGRDAYERRSWREAYESLSRAAEAAPLAAADLELLATAASLVGRVDEYLSILERTHHAYVDAGEPLAAARCAFWLGINLALRGEMGSAGGWFGRVDRLVEREGPDVAELGYVRLRDAFARQAAGDPDGAYAAAADAASAGERFGDADLFASAVHFQGLARIKQARVEEGLRLLDEAMVAVTAGEASPIVTGLVYCGVIAGCEEAYEPRRAQEWTAALTEWCEDQPQMVAFTGRCLAHRAEIMQLHGAWGDALDEARLARERCEQAMNARAAGHAFYQQGEVHRLQGDVAAAEAAYRDANRCGREPQPGLALLRLAQGDEAAAAGAIRRALGETVEPLKRARLLPAYVEIMLASGDAEEARSASAELTAIAGAFESPMLDAIAARIRGAVDLADGDAAAALTSLRRALEVWQELDAPYEDARTRVLVALCCRALGDDDSGALELEAARAAFEELGAAPDVARLDELTGRGRPKAAGGLTAREVEVLALAARGSTNREIADALVISEHTVRRHLQNTFAKLRVSSRAAATAYAVKHDLI